ncbi:hypothetical protein MKW92_016237 [Papaver armeniacum]|nr:hypothetical protein MKW92_016237 [Papaver armeniacum]
MCIIVARKEGDNVLFSMLKNVIGTLDFRGKYLSQGETYPEPVSSFSAFKERGSQKYDIISSVTARQQGVRSSMLKFESAKEDGIKQVFLHVRRDNKPALAVYRKMGFEILSKATPHLEEQNLYVCSINL